MVLLCQTTPKASDQFVDIVGGLLLTSSQETVLLLCQTLASFGSMKRGVLSLLLPEICNAINTVIESEVDTGNAKIFHYRYLPFFFVKLYYGCISRFFFTTGSTAPVLTLLTTMLFQTLRDHSLSESAAIAVKSAVGNVDQWSAYCIGRSAAR